MLSSSLVSGRPSARRESSRSTQRPLARRGASQRPSTLEHDTRSLALARSPSRRDRTTEALSFDLHSSLIVRSFAATVLPLRMITRSVLRALSTTVRGSHSVSSRVRVECSFIAIIQSRQKVMKTAVVERKKDADVII